MKAAEQISAAKEGFCGAYYAAENEKKGCMIVLIGDESDDIMNKACAKWLVKGGPRCSALCIGVHQNPKEEGGVHSWPMETVEKAIDWLQKRSVAKIGILGMSMQAGLALCAASLFPSISLAVAWSPNDFIPWGFYQGRMGREAHAEWPSGGSAFSYRGEDLPFQPSGLQPQAYWQMFCDEKKKYGEMHSISIFEYSENAHPIPEECRIHVENIRGRVVLMGAEDDAMWNAAKYIRRMETRLQEKQFTFPVDVLLYPFGTHLLVPQSMVKNALWAFGNFVPCLFASGRKHLRECRRARIDAEKKLDKIILDWKQN